MRSFLDKIFEFRNVPEESPRDTSIETHLVIAFVPSPQLPYSPDLSMLHSQLGEKIIEIIHKFQNYPKVLSLLAFFFLPVSPLEIQSGPTFTVLRIPWCLLDGIFDGIEVCNENENPIDVKVSRVFESTNKKRFHLSSRVIEAFYHSHWVHVGANKAIVYEERVPEVIEFELTGKKSRTFNPFANEKSRRDKKEILIPWESLAFLTKLGSLFSWFEPLSRLEVDLGMSGISYLLNTTLMSQNIQVYRKIKQPKIPSSIYDGSVLFTQDDFLDLSLQLELTKTIQQLILYAQPHFTDSITPFDLYNLIDSTRCANENLVYYSYLGDSVKKDTEDKLNHSTNHFLTLHTMPHQQCTCFLLLFEFSHRSLVSVPITVPMAVNDFLLQIGKINRGTHTLSSSIALSIIEKLPSIELWNVLFEVAPTDIISKRILPSEALEELADSNVQIKNPINSLNSTRNKRLRVILFGTSQIDGFNKILLDQCKYLPRDIFQVHWVSLGSATAQSETYIMAKELCESASYFPAVMIPRKYFTESAHRELESMIPIGKLKSPWDQYFEQVFEVIRNIDIAIVANKNENLSALDNWLVILARIARVKVIGIEMQSYPLLFGMAKHATAIFAPSKFVCEEKKTANVIRQLQIPCFVINLGISLQYFHVDTPIATNRWNDLSQALCDFAPFRVGFVGRLVPVKSLSLLFRAVSMLRLKQRSLFGTSKFTATHCVDINEPDEFIVGQLKSNKCLSASMPTSEKRYYDENYHQDFRINESDEYDAEKDRFVGMELIVVGDGEILNDLKRFDSTLHPAASPKYVGLCPYDEIPSIMSSFHVLVVPSLVSETFGMVGIEAMAAGTPVLTTGIGGTVEFSLHMTTEATAESMANELEKLYLMGRSGLRELGKKGRRLVEQKFTIEKTVARYAKLYQELLKSELN